MSPGHSLPFDRIADRYDETRGGIERGRRIAADLAPLLRGVGGRPVLEIGVGTGLIAAGLDELGLRTVGVDLSLPMVARAVSRLGGGRVAVGDAAALPFASGTFAAAYSVWVLHVVGDQAAVLAEAARVLVPGACYAIVSGRRERPVDDPVGELIWGMNRQLDPDGLRDDGPERLAALARAAGFVVRESRFLPPRERRESPARAAAEIEARSSSKLWDVDDETWARVVAPVVAALRAMPHPEAPITRRGAGVLTVLKKA